MQAEEKPDITAVLEAFGADTSRVREYGWNTIRCPFTDNHPHGDRHPSGRVNPEAGYYKCWSCGVEGDSYDIIEEHEGVDFVGARSWAADHLGFEGGAVREAPQRTRRYRPSWIEEDD